jgi:hypothetical protein
VAVNHGVSGWQEQLARTIGQLAIITMSLLILPAARNSVWETVRRLSIR